MHKPFQTRMSCSDSAVAQQKRTQQLQQSLAKTALAVEPQPSKAVHRMIASKRSWFEARWRGFCGFVCAKSGHQGQYDAS
jgi:hypothetical protein